MSDVLFVTWDGGGNLPPALGIARELQARGHTVRFLGHAAQADRLAAAGVEVVAPRRARPFTSQQPQGPLALIAALGDRGMGHDLLRAVAHRKPDLVVIDCLMFGAMDAARRAGLRFVVLEHLYDGYYERGCLRGPLGVTLALRRLAPRRALAAAAARMVTTVPELDPAGHRADGPTSSGLTFTGPVVDVAPVAADRWQEPLVLISLSTTAIPGTPATLQRLIEAAAGLDARVVVTTGPCVDPDELRVPPGVEVHRFVPHAELMPRATVMVGHGGHGTTMQALAHDLPLVVVPMHPLTDQPLVARSVEEAGAGRVASRRAGPAALAPVLAAMLADGPHRTAAARLGRLVRSRPGAARGADTVESVLRDAAPGPDRPAARP